MLHFILTVLALALGALLLWNVFWLLVLAAIWTVHGTCYVIERVGRFFGYTG